MLCSHVLVEREPMPNRVQRVVLTYQALISLLSLHGRRLLHIHGLPPDATIVTILPDDRDGTLEVLVRSSSFDPVPEGQEVPERDLRVATQLPVSGVAGALVFFPPAVV